MRVATPDLYDKWAQQWSRDEAALLSDFTARPFILDLCFPYASNKVLDLGCGEGYMARQMKKMGAGTITAIDISEKMISQANIREDQETLGIDYSVGNATSIDALESNSYDLVVAVFLFNYLNTIEMSITMKNIKRVLKPDGKFVFSVPHPNFPFISDNVSPFYFSNNGAGYFSGRNQQFEGEIFNINGGSVPVRCIHKTYSDYMNSLKFANFTSLPEIYELCVTKEHLEINQSFFSPVIDKPLHLVVSIEV